MGVILLLAEDGAIKIAQVLLRQLLFGKKCVEVFEAMVNHKVVQLSNQAIMPGSLRVMSRFIRDPSL